MPHPANLININKWWVVWSAHVWSMSATPANVPIDVGAGRSQKTNRQRPSLRLQWHWARSFQPFLPGHRSSTAQTWRRSSNIPGKMWEPSLEPSISPRASELNWDMSKDVKSIQIPRDRKRPRWISSKSLTQKTPPKSGFLFSTSNKKPWIKRLTANMKKPKMEIRGDKVQNVSTVDNWRAARADREPIPVNSWSYGSDLSLAVSES